MQKKIGRSPLCRPGHRGRVRLMRTGLCNKPARYALSCGIKCDTQLGEQAHVRSDSSRHNDWVHRWKYLASRLHNHPLAIAYNLIDSDVFKQLDHAAIQQLASLQAELSALFQLIIRTTTQNALKRTTPNRPDDISSMGFAQTQKSRSI